MIRSIAFVAALAIVQGCPPSPTPPGPIRDAAPHTVGDASTSSVHACHALAKLGCADGLAENCAATLDHVQTSRITHIDIACILTAHDQGEARTCGSVCQ